MSKERENPEPEDCNSPRPRKSLHIAVFKEIEKERVESINSVEDLFSKAKECFDRFDRDGSKTLDISEVQRALGFLQQKNDLPTVIRWLERVDKNLDEKIDFGEFMEFVMDQWNERNGKEAKSRDSINSAFKAISVKTKGEEEFVEKEKIEKLIDSFGLEMKIDSPKKTMNLNDFCEEFNQDPVEY